MPLLLGRMRRWRNTWHILLNMATKFLKFLLKKLPSVKKNAEGGEILTAIASDLAEKRDINEAQQKRVKDAIRRGSKITKHRIPL